jgi:hypothetical protein
VDWLVHAVRVVRRHVLECRQHRLEAIAQILQHVVAVHADAVPGVDRRRRAADQDRTWNEMLQVALGGHCCLAVSSLGSGLRPS